jgi:SAM-dependent methyltransferase
MSAEAPLSTRALDRCLACGTARVEPLPLRYEFRGQSFPLVECAICGMRFLRLQPTGEALAELYSAGYFERDFRCGRSPASYSEEEAFRDENLGLLAGFERLTGPGDLLEVGCAGGWLLKHARERGWRVRGVELSAAAVAQARALDLDVAHGELADARLPAAAFDLVYMGDVLEHVPDCRAALAEALRVLRPGGWLYLRGPITTHSLARSLALRAAGWLGRPLVLREPPYHLWEFTPRSLRRLFEAVGLEVRELRQSKIPPGRFHGDKTLPQRMAMAALDAVNLPLTALCNARGDRIVVVASKPG